MMIEQLIKQDFIIHAITKRYEAGELPKDIYEQDVKRRTLELLEMIDIDNIIKHKKETGWTGGQSNG